MSSFSGPVFPSPSFSFGGGGDPVNVFQVAGAGNGDAALPPTVIDICRGVFDFSSVAKVFDRSVKTIRVSGEPIEITIECDYKTIEVSGKCHRIFLIGICNTVNLTGDLHSVFFDGFSNEINYMSAIPCGKCAIWGELLDINCKLGRVVNGNFVIGGGPKPKKLEFPSSCKNGRRHRFTWQLAQVLDSDKFLNPPPEPEVEEDEEWEEYDEDEKIDTE